MVIFGVDYGLLGMLLGAGLWLPSPWLKLLAGLASGLVIGQLFVIGHDACHGSFSKNRRLNRVIGTLAFLPSLTPFSTWEFGHNQLHHAYTNLKPRDFVWAPFSKNEYDALTPLRRALERLYRTPIGHGLYYFLEIWCKRLFFPRRPNIEKPGANPCPGLGARRRIRLRRRSGHGSRRILHGPERRAGAALLAGRAAGRVLLPSSVFSSTCTIRAPTSAGMPTRHEWTSAGSQIDTVQHVVFPGLLNVMFQNIMEHHAHHLDPSISMHQLRPAQAALEAALGAASAHRPLDAQGVLRGITHLQALRLRDAPLARLRGQAHDRADRLSDDNEPAVRAAVVAQPRPALVTAAR